MIIYITIGMVLVLLFLNRASRIDKQKRIKRIEKMNFRKKRLEKVGLDDED